MAGELTPSMAQTIQAEQAELPESVGSYGWMDWAKEWGREKDSVHPRLWEGLDNDEKLAIDEYADIEEEEESPPPPKKPELTAQQIADQKKRDEERIKRMEEHKKRGAVPTASPERIAALLAEAPSPMTGKIGEGRPA